MKNHRSRDIIITCVVSSLLFLFLMLGGLYIVNSRIDDAKDSISAKKDPQIDTLAKVVEALQKQLSVNGLQPVVSNTPSDLIGVPGIPGPSGISGLPGPQGTPGLTGVTGATGASGSQGTSGETGTPGSAGSSGVQGAQGNSGVSGAPGPQGESGSPGAPGSSGPSGPQGEPGQDGEPGPAPASFSFTYTDSLAQQHTFTCTDPESDGNYTCEEV